MPIDLDKARVESARWYILLALDAGRPFPLAEDIILRALSDASHRLTLGEIRRELAYLEGRKLLTLTGRESEHWEAELTSLGIDLVEYTIDCKPGIARPPKR